MKSLSGTKRRCTLRALADTGNGGSQHICWIDKTQGLELSRTARRLAHHWLLTALGALPRHGVPTARRVLEKDKGHPDVLLAKSPKPSHCLDERGYHTHQIRLHRKAIIRMKSPRPLNHASLLLRHFCQHQSCDNSTRFCSRRKLPVFFENMARQCLSTMNSLIFSLSRLDWARQQQSASPSRFPS